MTQLVTTNQSERIMEVLVAGNLSVLTPPERLDYYNRVCESLQLNPLTQPFAFITLNGKLTLYALKACTDQLRAIHKISISEPHVQQQGDMYIVTVTGTDVTGRQDSDMGVVAIGGLKGENLANAMLKAMTKAKRRLTLSICGLGMLDETEIADIPASAKREPVRMPEAIPEPRQRAEKPANAPAVDTETGELSPLWTNAGLKQALAASALTIKDLSPLLGTDATRDNYAELIDTWMFDNPGQSITDLIAAAVAFHTGASEPQPALMGTE